MGEEPTTKGAQTSGRDLRIDVLRGLALVTIFIDHAPKNPWASYTIGKFGFSDAAEAFVLMSGIAAGLAYSRPFFGDNSKQACIKIWRRAGVIYGAHIFATVAVIGLLLALSLIWPLMPLIKELNVAPFLQHPIQATTRLFLLTYQLGYFNILPLYTALLLVLPLFLLVGRWRLDALLGLSAGLWLVTHLIGLYVPGWPSGARWFLNPFGWQLLFVFGLMVGIRKKQGRMLVPFAGWLYAACIAFVIAGCWWQLSGRPALPRVSLMPGFVYDMTKDNLAFLRLLHILALGYVIAHSKWLSWLLQQRFFILFAVLGQVSLTTFVTGSLIAAFLHMLRVVVPQDVFLDTVLLLLGVAIQYGLARRALNAKKTARLNKRTLSAA
ncbi:OpgC family protein [Cohaesibacter sp. ES.047]|uniref:OpgC family protein n=1 Tax=Cohaesibacter sp. ES.047 TaxID=1798205 RepID=UPI0012FDD823|nr:OpgC domain-containing protein [Cohaesibacter sp. ES.047]